VAGSAPALVTVSQKDRAFAPAVIRLSAGGSLEVLNDDTRRHNVRVQVLDINTGIQRPGETVHIRFPEPGRYGAYCGIHPEMRLTVEVTPPPGARR
jgi:cytochrome c peroxidase